MPGGRRAASLFTVFALVAGSSAAGCSSDDRVPSTINSAPRPATTPPARSSAIGGAGTTVGQEPRPLPLDAYMYSDEQRAAVQQAENALAGECMRRYGFDPLPVPDLPAPPALGDRRYFQVGLARAQQFGYSVDDLIVAAQSAMDAVAQTPMTDSYARALYGTSGPQQRGAARPGGSRGPGGATPSDGCLGEARATVAGEDTNGGLAQLVSRLQLEAFDRSQHAPSTEHAIADWAACMQGRGFTYRTPADATNDPRWSSPGATPEEIATAVADMGCKESVGLVDIWYQAEVEEQERVIESNQLALEEIKRAIDAQVERAAEVLAGEQ